MLIDTNYISLYFSLCFKKFYINISSSPSTHQSSSFFISLHDKSYPVKTILQDVCTTKKRGLKDNISEKQQPKEEQESKRQKHVGHIFIFTYCFPF